MAVVTFQVDPEAQANAAAGGGRLLPEGKYVLRVDNFNHKPAKEAGKFPQVELKCVVEASSTGNNIGQKVTRYISLSPKAAPYRLIPFLKAAGIAYQDYGNGTIAFDDAYLVGVRTNVECKHDRSGQRPREDWDGDEPVAGHAAPQVAQGAPAGWAPPQGAPPPVNYGPPQGMPPTQFAPPGQQYQQPMQMPQQQQWAPPGQPPQLPPQQNAPQQIVQQPTTGAPGWMQPGMQPGHVAGQGAPPPQGPPRGYGQG